MKAISWMWHKVIKEVHDLIAIIIGKILLLIDRKSESQIDDKVDDHDKKTLMRQKYAEASHLYASWTDGDKEHMTLQDITLKVNHEAPFLAVVGPVGSGKVKRTDVLK